MGQFEIQGSQLGGVLVPDDPGAAHVALAQAVMARRKTKEGRWRGASRLPAPLQPLAADRSAQKEAA